MSKKKRLFGKDLMESLKNDGQKRRELFEGLLRHLRAGFSLDCYGPLAESSIYEMLKSFPEEWCQGELDEAIRDAKNGWESIGRRQADGQCLGNSRSWIYNMMNRFDWTDKSKVETSGTQAVSVNIVSYESVNPTQASS